MADSKTPAVQPELLVLREKIDAVDRELLSLLNRREPSLTRDVAGFLTMTFLAIAAMTVVWSVAPRGPDYGDLTPGYAPQIDPYTGAITWVAETR